MKTVIYIVDNMKNLLCIFIFILIGCTGKHPDKINSVSIKKIVNNSNKDSVIIDSVIVREFSYKNLSTSFDIKVKFRRILIKDVIHDSSIVNVTIIDKFNQKQLDTINFHSTYFFESVFNSNENVRSYSTKKNIYKDVHDNDYGDIIIADFNFDSKDDIAIKSNSGGNGGPDYNFYLQGLNKHFYLDGFLTDSMGYFPDEINEKNKTLVTLAHANVMEQCKTTYKLTNRWKKIKQEFIGY